MRQFLLGSTTIMIIDFADWTSYWAFDMQRFIVIEIEALYVRHSLISINLTSQKNIIAHPINQLSIERHNSENQLLQIIFLIMQLLKLASSYNSVANHSLDKTAYSKNYFLDILQKCKHIPKDDRLILRGYLSNLKNFDETNEIINLLLKCSPKRNKQNRDQKLQILLRKQAEKIKKQNLTKISQTKKVQNQINNQNYKQIVMNTRKYCNNFQILRNTIRIPSLKKSCKSLLRQMPSNRQNSYSKQKSDSLQLHNQFSYSKMKSLIKSVQPKHLTHKNLASDPCRKYCKTMKNNLRKSQKIENLNTNQNIKKQQKQQFDKRQMRKSNFIPFQVKQTHKYTKSRSLGSLAVNYQEQKQIQHNSDDLQSQQIETEQNLYSYRSQNVDKQAIPTSGIENSNISQNIQNSYLSNFSTVNCRNTNFDICKQYMTVNSIHVSLKNLKIKAQSLFEFIVPSSIRQFRSPSDLSIPYSEFISRLNDFILQNCNVLNNEFCSPASVYIPFHTQYDLVTFDKLTQFIDQYTIPIYQNNQIRDLYTRMQIGLSGSGNIIFNQKRICLEEFRNAFKWKKNRVVPLFQRVIKRCSQWGTCITYWELFWLRQSKQLREFQKQYNID